MHQRTILVILVTITLAFVGISLPYPVIPPLLLKDGGMTAQFSHDNRTLIYGVIMALYGVGQLIGCPILGRYADRVGRRPVMIVSLLFAFIGYLIMAWSVMANSLIMLMLSRLMVGFCEGNVAIVNSIAADISTEKTKSSYFSWINVMINVGWIIGPILGGKLADPAIFSGFSYDTPFWVAAVLILINLLMVIWMLPETLKDRSHSDKARGGYRQLLKQAGITRIFVISAISYTGIFIYFLYFAYYYVERFGLSPGELANYAAIISIPMIIAGLLVPHLEKRLSIRTLGIIGHLLMAIGLASYMLPQSAVWTLVPMMAVGAGICIAELSTSIAVSNLADSRTQGQAMGAYRAITVAVGVIASLLGSYLATFDITLPFWAAALFSMICVFSFFGMQSGHSAHNELTPSMDSVELDANKS